MWKIRISLAALKIFRILGFVVLNSYHNSKLKPIGHSKIQQETGASFKF